MIRPFLYVNKRALAIRLKSRQDVGYMEWCSFVHIGVVGSGVQVCSSFILQDAVTDGGTAVKLGDVFFAAQAAKLGGAIFQRFADAPRNRLLDGIARGMDSRFDGETSRIGHTITGEVIVQRHGCHIFVLIYDAGAGFSIAVANKKTGSVYSASGAKEKGEIGVAVVGIDDASPGIHLYEVTSHKSAGRYTVFVKYLSEDVIESLTSKGERRSDGWRIPVTMERDGTTYEADAWLWVGHYHLKLYDGDVIRAVTGDDDKIMIGRDDFESLKRGESIDVRCGSDEFCIGSA